jgi:hypothetical protein
MKQADVKVGEQYMARISGALVRVTVLAVTSKSGWSSRGGGRLGQGGLVSKTAYRVRNERTGREVTKSAAALRPAVKRTAEEDMSALVSYTDPSHRDRYLVERESDKDG